MWVVRGCLCGGLLQVAVGMVWCRLFSVVSCFCCRVRFVSSVAVRLPSAGFCLCEAPTCVVFAVFWFSDWVDLDQ